MCNIVTRNAWYVRETPISLEQYLCDQIVKNNEKSQYRDEIYRQYKENIKPRQCMCNGMEWPSMIKS